MSAAGDGAVRFASASVEGTVDAEAAGTRLPQLIDAQRATDQSAAGKRHDRRSGDLIAGHLIFQTERSLFPQTRHGTVRESRTKSCKNETTNTVNSNNDLTHDDTDAPALIHRTIGFGNPHLQRLLLTSAERIRLNNPEEKVIYSHLLTAGQ